MAVVVVVVVSSYVMVNAFQFLVILVQLLQDAMLDLKGVISISCQLFNPVYMARQQLLLFCCCHPPLGISGSGRKNDWFVKFLPAKTA